MKLKHVIGAVVVSTAAVLACSNPAPAGTSVESPDAWAERDAATTVALDATAVAGYESPPASVSAVQAEPAPGPDWEVTEGHVTLVGVDGTQYGTQ